jgi:hypothetical protein
MKKANLSQRMYRLMAAEENGMPLCFHVNLSHSTLIGGLVGEGVVRRQD